LGQEEKFRRGTVWLEKSGGTFAEVDAFAKDLGEYKHKKNKE